MIVDKYGDYIVAQKLLHNKRRMNLRFMKVKANVKPTLNSTVKPIKAPIEIQ